MKFFILAFLSLVITSCSYSDPTLATFEKICKHAFSATDKKDVQRDLSRIIASFESSRSTIPLYYLRVSQIYFRLGDTRKALIEVKKEHDLLGKMATGALLVITGNKVEGNRILSALAQIYYTRIVQETKNRKTKLRQASNIAIVSKIVGVNDINGLLAALENNGILSKAEVGIVRNYVNLDRDQILATIWPKPLR